MEEELEPFMQNNKNDRHVVPGVPFVNGLFGQMLQQHE